MKMQKSYRNIIVVATLSMTITACNSGSSDSTTSGASSKVSTVMAQPQISYLSLQNLPESASQCYATLASYASNIAAINNSGVVAGFLQLDPAANCHQKSFLWNSTKNSLSVIDYPTPSESSIVVIGSRVASLSSNLITSGITFTDPTQPGNSEYATYNNQTTPFVMAGWNYGYGVAENGSYLVGTNFAGQPLFWNILTNRNINLELNGESGLNLLNVQLYNVSNNGTAVGAYSSNGYNSAIICHSADQICHTVDGGADNGYDSFLTVISSDATTAYGWRNYSDGTQRFYRLNLSTMQITPLLTGNYDILGINALANDNVVLLQNEDTQLPEIYVAGQGSYSVAQLATKLKLIDSIEYTSIAISPNGNYLSFDVQSYKNNIFGVKVYFPQGVAAYLHNNLTTINKKEHHDA